MKDDNYIFAIIALGHLGDTILVEPLCANIKNQFPNSKIIFIVNKSFEEIPLGFKSVDEIYGYDKYNKNKGLLGNIKFALKFPYRNKIDYSIITHPHERSIIAAKLIGSKNIISLPIKYSPLNIFINKKRERNSKKIKNIYKGDFNSQYLLPLCKCKFLPVCYERNDINFNIIKNKYKLPEIYTVLSPTSKELIKDWDYANIKRFIENNINTTVLIGTDKANIIAKMLIEDKIKFIDLTNKTNISELGAIIKKSDTCISVDTGTFHLAYAQGVKTIGLFFNKRAKNEWTPTNIKCIRIIEGKKYKIKNKIICEKNIAADDVIKEVKKQKYDYNKCMSIL